MTAVWTGDQLVGQWTDPQNWQDDRLPAAGEDVVIVSAQPITLEIREPVPNVGALIWQAPAGTLRVIGQAITTLGTSIWQAGRVQLENSSWSSPELRVAATAQAIGVASLADGQIVQEPSGALIGPGTWRVTDAQFTARQIDAAFELVHSHLQAAALLDGVGQVRVSGHFFSDDQSVIHVTLIADDDGVRADHFILGDVGPLHGTIAVAQVGATTLTVGDQVTILTAQGGLAPSVHWSGLDTTGLWQWRPQWLSDQLSLEVIPQISADALEPNPSCLQAADLGHDDITMSHLSIDRVGDEDYFRWTAPDRGVLAVQLFFDRLAGDLDLWAYSNRQSVIDWSATQSNHEFVRLPVVSGEVFCFRVFAFGGDVQPDYDLALYLAPDERQVLVSHGDEVDAIDALGVVRTLAVAANLNVKRWGDVELGAAGMIYVASESTDNGAARILELTPRGYLSRQFDLPLEPTPGTRAYPNGFEVLEDHSFLIAQPNAGQVLHAARQMAPQVVLTGLVSPSDATVRSTGQVEVTSFQRADATGINPDRNGAAWYVSATERTVRLESVDGSTLRLLTLPDDLVPIEAQAGANGIVYVLARQLTDTVLLTFDDSGATLASWHLKGAPGGLAVLDVDQPARMPLADEDEDGLLDEWEKFGVDINQDGIIDLDLPALGADPGRKDVFVEVDAMTGRQPLPMAPPADVVAHGLATGTVLDRVVQSFLAAPVANPDGSTGIQLHVMLDDLNLPLSPFATRWNEFDALKSGVRSDGRDGTFGTAGDRASANWPAVFQAKQQVFRYAMFADRIGDSQMSGVAELPGNDLMVSLGAWNIPGGTADQQAGTFMHELGHTLGLRHGGSDYVNFKPNYFSVMNYHWQVPHALHAGWSLDYSSQALPSLDETRLTESAGIGGPDGGIEVPIGPLPLQVVPAAGAVDWNRNGNLDPFGTEADVNRGFADSNGDGLVNQQDDSPGQKLQGSDDWQRLRYSFVDLQNIRDFGDGDKDRPEDGDSDLTDLYDETPPDFIDRGSGGNDTRQNAYCLEPLESIWGLTIDTVVDLDWFKFIASATQDVRFAFDVHGAAGQQLNLQLFDDVLNVLADWTNAAGDGYHEQTIHVTRDTLYYLRVRGASAQDTGTYDLYFDAGDFNHDQVLNLSDIALLCAGMGLSSPNDLNGDDNADLQDVSFLVQVLLKTDFGDANLDGVFDSGDLVSVFQAGQYEDQLATNSSWSTGDWNCDGEFDTADLVLAFQAGAYRS